MENNGPGWTGRTAFICFSAQVDVVKLFWYDSKYGCR